MASAYIRFDLYKALILLFVLITVLSLTGCKQNEADDKPTEYIINDNKITIPPYFKHVWYREINNSINLSLNADNFQMVKIDFEKKEHAQSTLNIEIRPLREEFGEDNYWTEKDPILKTTPYNCKNYTLGEDAYKLCENGDKVPAIPGKHDFYTIYEEDVKYPISIIGCSDLEKYETLQKVCKVRAIIPHNMQLEYQYRLKDLPRAFELDLFVRHLSNSLITPTKE